MKQFTFDGSNSEGGKVIIKAIIARITESLSYQVWISLGGLFYLSFYRVRLINCPYNGFNSVWLMEYLSYPVDTGLKLNVHKTFIRRPGRLLNVLCTFNLRPVSTAFILVKIHSLWRFVAKFVSNIWMVIRKIRILNVQLRNYPANFFVFQHVFKMSWRRLHRNNFSSSKTSVLQLCVEDVFKTSRRRFGRECLHQDKYLLGRKHYYLKLSTCKKQLATFKIPVFNSFFSKRLFNSESTSCTW